ncbi:glutaminyl-peptide cyclotransferase [Labilibacter sediminis]|nr:glutaminyl-peptide cyclotransferase [Labilibacter sediminis]
MFKNQMLRGLIPTLTIALLIFSCNKKKDHSHKLDQEKTIPLIGFDYVGSYPHSTNSFTEGLLVHDGRLYESTGSPEELPQTRSQIGTVDLRTGNIKPKVEIDRNKYFGEGIVILNEKVYQLTYKSKTGFIYDINNFKKIAEFAIPSKEGWGMTTDGTNLIMSDGTNALTYLNAEDCSVIKKINVTENGFAKDYLNELEFIHGYIYANVWMTNTIVKIDSTNGKVVGVLDLSLYASDAKSIFNGSLEMNGIAYDSIRDRTYITGKMWPKIYEIKIHH